MCLCVSACVCVCVCALSIGSSSMSEHTTINIGRGNTALSPSRSNNQLRGMQQTLISSTMTNPPPPSSSSSSTSSSIPPPSSQTTSLALFPGAPRPFSKTRNVVVLGGISVGKSALCTRWTSDRFDDSYEPTYENHFSKIVSHRSGLTECVIKDTQGLNDQEVFRNEYGLGFHGYVLVYSIASKTSFETIQVINKKLLNLIGTNDVPRVLVGNKTDLSERQVTTAQGQQLADKWGCAFVECSAKFNLHVDNAFVSLLDQIDRSSEPDQGSTLFGSSGSCPCCRIDFSAMDSSGGYTWDKIIGCLHFLTLLIGILASSCAIALWTQNTATESELVAYILFGFGFLLAVISMMGLYGVKKGSVDFLRVYTGAMGILTAGEILVWILLYTNLSLFKTYIMAASIGGAIAIFIQVIATSLNFAYTGSVQQRFNSVPSPLANPIYSNFAASYHSLYD